MLGRRRARGRAGAVGARVVRRREPDDLGARVAPRRGGVRHPGRRFRADTARIPASTMKLVTSAGALLQLGPDFRFRTTRRRRAGDHPQGQGARGARLPQGSGDPLLATRSYSAAFLSGKGDRVSGLARPLRTRGIRVRRGPSSPTSGSSTRGASGPGGPPTTGTSASPLSGLATNQDYAGNGRSSPRLEPTDRGGAAPEGHARRLRRRPGRAAEGRASPGRRPGAGDRRVRRGCR